MKKVLMLIILLTWNAAIAQDEIFLNGTPDPCGMHGSSKVGSMEYDKNPFKNRYIFPVAADLDDNLSLEDFVNGNATEDKFNENKAVTITGYVYNVKPGGKETCNCKATEAFFKDTHIEITLNDRQTGPEHRFIVEVTPRIRKLLADNGTDDWTTETLRNRIKHHMVRIQGWLFYDASHRHENFADDPDDTKGKTNWRATSWEIHPVTSIEVLDELEAGFEDRDENDFDPVVPTSGPVAKNNRSSIAGIGNNTPKTPSEILSIILLGALLGAAGQGVRIAVGLKKLNDVSSSKEEFDRMFDAKRLAVSLMYAVTIGIVAGIFMAVDSLDKVWDKAAVTAVIAAGYAGADFISGFMSRSLPSEKSSTPRTTVVTGTPKEGGIPQ